MDKNIYNIFAATVYTCYLEMLLKVAICEENLTETSENHMSDMVVTATIVFRDCRFNDLKYPMSSRLMRLILRY